MLRLAVTGKKEKEEESNNDSNNMELNTVPKQHDGEYKCTFIQK